ncbi:MAG: ATP:cob(I)alamin adenosyltransferase, partial [Paramuribaculum sp.]|nr:ATP:cob(I)alamin adenosyltransferase [Paramuribaculum sp.]
MKRIYTRSGDTGLTATHGGARIPKYHPRIEAVGELDELNTAIGMVRTMCEPSLPGFDRLRDIQLLLMTLMSRVATPADRRDSNPNPLPGSLVAD